MNICYHDRGEADPALRRIVDHRASALERRLVQAGREAIALDVQVIFDLRSDRYESIVTLRLADETLAGHGVELMRSAAVIAAFNELGVRVADDLARSSREVVSSSELAQTDRFH
jgi:hypothetical protein